MPLSWGTPDGCSTSTFGDDRSESDEETVTVATIAKKLEEKKESACSQNQQTKNKYKIIVSIDKRDEEGPRIPSQFQVDQHSETCECEACKLVGMSIL